MKDKHAPAKVKYSQYGTGNKQLIFIHGFLDAAAIWKDTIALLDHTQYQIIAVDLAGMGENIASQGPVSLERFTSDVLEIVDTLHQPFVVIGQSMGAQVAELVAVSRPPLARGLVLLSPVPLAGVGLNDKELEPFAGLGGNAQAQQAVRSGLASALPESRLKALVELGLKVDPLVVRDSAKAWNTGHVSGNAPSTYSGPVWIARGEQDAFVTEELALKAVTPRFPGAKVQDIAGTGHWPHFENPAAVADGLNKFLPDVDWTATTDSITADGVRSQGWTRAFAEKSQQGFASAFDADVTLQASVLHIPVQGAENVKAVMATASNIYESLVFTHEAVNGPRSYLEWSATAFGGMKLLGVTVLEKADDGRILNVAIHHRPLTAALRFSIELRERLAGVIDASHFYQEPVTA